MNRRAYERMEHEVRAIHRALTGEEPRLEEGGPADGSVPTEEELERRFTELAIDARSIPGVATALATLRFSPAVDVVELGDEVLVEALLPGIAARDVDVHVIEQTLFLAGGSVAAQPSDRVYVHAEIPRGPFSRVVPLPCDVSSHARLELDDGVVRIHLRKVAQPRADAHAEE